MWAPSDGVLARVAFPLIRTFDSSRTPTRGEQTAAPRTLAEVDLSAITAALAGMDASTTDLRAEPAADGREQLFHGAQGPDGPGAGSEQVAYCTGYWGV